MFLKKIFIFTTNISAALPFSRVRQMWCVWCDKGAGRESVGGDQQGCTSTRTLFLSESGRHGWGLG